MGKGSTEIQRDIQHQRESLSRRVDALDSRVREDVETTRQEAKDRVQFYADKAKEQGEKVKDKAMTAKDKAAEANNKLPGSDSKLAEHPNLLMLGSFTAGMVLGMVTGGDDESDAQHPQRRDTHSQHIHGQSSSEPGMIGQGMDKAKGLVAGQLTTVLQDLMDQFMGKSGKEGESSGREGGIPAFMKSAWDSFSGSRDDSTHEREPASGHMEIHDRDLPHSRKMSDLEERTAEDMNLTR